MAQRVHVRDCPLTDPPTTARRSRRPHVTHEMLDPNSHFEFGANWREFSRSIDESRIEESVAGLRRLLAVESLAGLTFLDLGCGSGIHAVAALRLGAASVRAIDLDPECVATARDTLSRYWPGENYSVEVANLFSVRSAESAGYDVVYSWGVLHHTGDLWGALRAASALVRPGGLLAIAVYKRTPFCGFWTWEKRLFNRAGSPLRKAIVWIYLAAKALRDVVRLRNPLRRLREQRKRGMHWYTSAVDWLGGHPYQSATPDEVRTFVEGQGLRLEEVLQPRASLGILGTGNAEYRFRRSG